MSSNTLDPESGAIPSTGKETESKEEGRVPRRYFIGTISALAFTTGLTLTLIPALRFRRNRQRALQTATHHPVVQQVGAGALAARRSETTGSGGGGGGGGMVLLPGLKPKSAVTTSPHGSASSVSTPISRVTPPGMVLLPTGSSITPPTPTPSPIPLNAQSAPEISTETLTPLSPSIKWFSLKPANPFEGDEEHNPNPNAMRSSSTATGNGSQDAEISAEPLSPLFALNAFLIATGAVCLLGAGGAVGVGRWLGVHDVSISSIFFSIGRKKRRCGC